MEVLQESSVLANHMSELHGIGMQEYEERFVVDSDDKEVAPQAGGVGDVAAVPIPADNQVLPPPHLLLSAGSDHGSAAVKPSSKAPWYNRGSRYACHRYVLFI